MTSSNGCSGNIPPISSVGFPGLCLSDAGNGLRSADYVSSWPSGWSVGASFNRDLARQRASGIAREFRAKGTNVALGPVVGPLGRMTLDGRLWEGFGSDPYLSGQLVYETVAAVQGEGVITSVKVRKHMFPVSSLPILTTGNSTTLAMNRRRSAIRRATSRPSRRTSTTRPCTSFTCGE